MIRSFGNGRHRAGGGHKRQVGQPSCCSRATVDQPRISPLTKNDYETAERAAFIYDALYASISKTKLLSNQGTRRKAGMKMKRDGNMLGRVLRHISLARKTRRVVLSVVAFASATLFVLVACSAPQSQSGQSNNQQQPAATDWKPVEQAFRQSGFNAAGRCL